MTRQEFLFSFGFEDPDEAKSNYLHGTDFESSRDLWIEADSADDALQWGKEVANHFVKWLFQSANGEADPWAYSWLDGRFASWVESDPTKLAAARALEIPSVILGELPEFEDLDANG